MAFSPSVSQFAIVFKATFEMKYFAVFLIACISVSCVYSVHTETWGNVINTKILGSETVVAEPAAEEQVKTLVFTQVTAILKNLCED